MQKTMKENINIPNCITASRIVGAILLIFMKPFSVAFYIIYSLCGFSDAVDGAVARATNKTSEFGAKLDSVADIFFNAVLLLKIFPFLWTNLPRIIWFFVACIIVIRLAAYTVAFIKYKRFASTHTYANKLTGAALYCVPYLVKLLDVVGVCSTVCVIAGFASAEELIIHIRSREYKSNVKTVFKA